MWEKMFAQIRYYLPQYKPEELDDEEIYLLYNGLIYARELERAQSIEMFT